MQSRGTDALNFYQLRILAAVVEHGSFSGAAEALGLTQPAISAQIRHLRQFAGAPLLVREGRQVVLTEVGRALYRHAEEMLGATDALRRELEDICRGERDKVLIAGPLAYVAYVLPSILSKFRSRHPSLRLSVIETSSRDAIERVRSARVDIGIVASVRVPKALVQDLVVGHLFDDEVVVIESPECPFSSNGQISLDSLAGIPFIGLVRGDTVTESGLNRRLLAAGLDPIKTVMQFSAWTGVKDAVRCGAGAALVFRSVAQRELERGDLRTVAVEGYSTRRPVDLICSPEYRGKHTSTVFQELLQYLLREVPRSTQRTGPAHEESSAHSSA
jgi:DNA-binding transcriptional LysR family regulator